MALNPTLPSLPYYGPGGIRTDFGTFLPPGARVVYLRSTGASNYDPPEIVDRLTTTLAAALLQVRANYGDVIYVLPGHSESVTTTPTFVAGVRIIGCGYGSMRPTFRWTATTSQWAINVADVVIAGCILRMEGANGVVKAINVTASGFHLLSNQIQTASGASNKATIAIELGEGATQCRIFDNYIYGTETHNSTDIVKLVGSTAPNHDFQFLGNIGRASVTAANGFVHVTTACLRMAISGNDLYNTHTSSSACITIDDVAADGSICYNSLATNSTGTATSGTEGIKIGTSFLGKAFQNFVANDPKTSGVLKPTVDT